MDEKMKEMLDIFERFGEKAQDALDFVKRNAGFAASADGVAVGNRGLALDGLNLVRPDFDVMLEDGVYIVYRDGNFAKFEAGISDEEGMRVGISWHGHRWLIGTDFGEQPWTKATSEELEANGYGIMSEMDALFDWDVVEARHQLGDLWKHIPLKDDEYLPTAPMVLVQERFAKYGMLNDALAFCRLPEYKVGECRWFVERYSVYYARHFSGIYGALTGYYVNNAFRTQAVTLWK